MFRSLTKTAILVTLIALVSACGPAATVVGPTAAATPPAAAGAPPTATAVPPTATIVPPTATAAPSTASPADVPPLGSGMIAFSSRREGTNGTDIYVMNADGTNQTRLTDTTALDGIPVWSP